MKFGSDTPRKPTLPDDVAERSIGLRPLERVSRALSGAAPPALRQHLTAFGAGVLYRRRARHWSVERTPPTRVGRVLVSGFLGGVFGVAQAGRLTAEALERGGWDVARHDLAASRTSLLTGRGTLPEAEVGGVWLIHANPPELRHALMAYPRAAWADRYRIGYWAGELPLAPRDWLEASRRVHEVWAPSRFVADGLIARARGSDQVELADRVRVVPHPVAAPGLVVPAPERYGMDPHRVEILCMMDARSSVARKNPLGAIEAFRRAFPRQQGHARLTIKVLALDQSPAWRRRLVVEVGGRSDIRLFDEALDQGEMRQFLRSVDILLSLHRSEGFGMVLAEAMALGRATIATGWSGNLDFMDDGNAILVPARQVPVRDPQGLYRGQTWAEPDLDYAADALRALADDSGWRARLGQAGLATPARLADAFDRAVAASGLPLRVRTKPPPPPQP
ncbi:glycosyltransferase family 4 protein [Caulobacter sp. LARHSG274]